MVEVQLDDDARKNRSVSRGGNTHTHKLQGERRNRRIPTKKGKKERAVLLDIITGFIYKERKERAREGDQSVQRIYIYIRRGKLVAPDDDEKKRKSRCCKGQLIFLASC